MFDEIGEVRCGDSRLAAPAVARLRHCLHRAGASMDGQVLLEICLFISQFCFLFQYQFNLLVMQQLPSKTFFCLSPKWFYILTDPGRAVCLLDKKLSCLYKNCLVCILLSSSPRPNLGPLDKCCLVCIYNLPHPGLTLVYWIKAVLFVYYNLPHPGLTWVYWIKTVLFV